VVSLGNQGGGDDDEPIEGVVEPLRLCFGIQSDLP
jgi:hypothetical protein